MLNVSETTLTDLGFDKIRQTLQNLSNSINNKEYTLPSTRDIAEVCIAHITLLEESKNIKASVNLSKKHINFYLKNFNNSSTYRKRLMLTDNTDDMKIILKELLYNN